MITSLVSANGPSATRTSSLLFRTVVAVLTGWSCAPSCRTTPRASISRVHGIQQGSSGSLATGSFPASALASSTPVSAVASSASASPHISSMYRIIATCLLARSGVSTTNENLRPGHCRGGIRQPMVSFRGYARSSSGQEIHTRRPTGRSRKEDVVSLPEIVTREEWLAARTELLAQGKEKPRQGGAPNAERRGPPVGGVS